MTYYLPPTKALEAENKLLKQRRTLNQRRQSDACLDRKRAKASEAKAKRVEQAFSQRFAGEVTAGIEREAADEREVQLELKLEDTKAELQQEQERCAKFKAIAEPKLDYFFHGGSYSIEHDLAGLEAIISCHVSAGQVPKLFFIFARFFRIKLPTYSRKVADKRAADGSTTSVMRTLHRIGGKTHFKELPAIAGEVHKIQLGEWLLEDADANYCYIADGANSLQEELMAHLVSRRSKKTGKLESMAVSIDAISDKTSEGQAAKFRAAKEAAADAWAEADALGLLHDAPEIAGGCCDEAAGEAAGEAVCADDTTPMDTEAAAAENSGGDEPADTAAAFHAARRELLRAKLRAKIAELRCAASMNDRAAPARKAARLVCGGDGSGGEGDVPDGATCAHHAVANIGEEGRKAIDKLLKALMNITDEQAESDAAKVKALRTSVGWFSSPACSLIYQVASD